MSGATDFGTRPRRVMTPLSKRLVLGAAVLVSILAGGDSLRAAWSREEARQRVDALRLETRVLREKARAEETGAGRDLTERRRALLTARAAPPRIVADLAAVLPPDARIERLELAYGDVLRIHLRVEARSPAAYDRLLEALAASGRLRDIVTGPEDREGEVTASIQATYRPQEDP